ncbi:hypothetical protein [Polyangium aurulentum]|uniref:hypothetical protein n=1 Tax=Polyangium aurulentum TaxID=2567896 RepID=UPI0010ADD959|nr:hypothetical protein [Polyangium aurulentum]UQA57893.1 hypothetical protein E8A73_042570 [Polyangium aurulentum]
MKRYGLTATWAILVLGSAAALAGCPVENDELPNTTGGPGTGGGMQTACGNAVLDSGEDCDDGNNAPNDGCTECKVDECFTCSKDPGKLSICMAGMAGQTCEMTKVCDANGACVECLDSSTCDGGYCFQGSCAKCDDGMKNGDETDVDCGGTTCTKCTQGKTCQIGGDCESAFCTDGVCCGEVCDAPCFSCNIEGSVGTCDFIAKYGEDPSYGAGMTCLAADGLACTGGGSCGKAVGSACASPAECASTKCLDPDMDMNKTCVALTGEPCTANGDCQSNVCTNSVCE